MKKKVVVIGGGNGGAISIVALKQNSDLFDISAVISMSDSGGSSGRLRKEFNTLPAGDIMRAALAMSKYDYPLLKQIFFRNRFHDAGKLDGHNLGNLALVLAEEYGKDFILALRALEQSVEAIGHAYPATLEKTDLVAELENGDIIKSEAAIDRPEYDLTIHIIKVWLEPPGAVYPGAVEAIERADIIIFGPGSLYTSVVAAILPNGVKEALNKSKAEYAFVTGNAYSADGETCPRTLSETVLALEKYLPRRVDLVLYGNHKLNDLQKENYKKRKWAILEDDKENTKNMNVIRADYERDEGGLCAIRLGKIFKDILWK